MAEENTSTENSSDDQYVVLARKYRPQNFDDLVGQDALVQTLTNAIKNNRLHHAYILTGIRGVGKTTTARIIAKALNCTGLDGKSGPTVHPCGVCENCRAITEGRHIDVMELDAASHTGVDDIREILDGVRYKPTNARYKIYIIDEVHMLSKSAFNALLKTLEEPPSHVKFIFATTEIRKVPVTILSRCQRFDLQRISIEDLTGLFKKILGNENIAFDEEALHIIAKAADGSARDGESLLDQAISLGGGKVRTDVVKNMIGLADRNQVFELFENLAVGKVDKVISNLQEQYKNGANPTTLLQDLINITHMLAKARIIPASVNDVSLTENERGFCTKMTPVVSIAVLSKIWQMLIKGIGELQVAPVQIDALEMILIRVAYSASLPTPYELLNDVKKNSSLGSSRPFEAAAGAPQNAPAPAPVMPARVETPHPDTAAALRLLASELSDSVYEVSEQQRAQLHLAAVFACNFTNHMYAIAQELLAEKGLPPQLIGPLISETAAKALGSPSAAAVQTGPARRGDRQTQQKHLGLLEGHPQLQELYQKISTEIWETSKKI